MQNGGNIAALGERRCKCSQHRTNFRIAQYLVRVNSKNPIYCIFNQILIFDFCGVLASFVELKRTPNNGDGLHGEGVAEVGELCKGVGYVVKLVFARHRVAA